MFNDDIRALTAKKYEILGELELAKAAILREMSTVDKCTLTRLREILAHYDRLEKSVVEKMNTLEVKTNVFISNAEKDYGHFSAALETLDEINKTVSELGETNTQIADENLKITKAVSDVQTYVANANLYATPFMYGAVGDGEHDDTSAFVDCISKNRNTYIPNGTFKITSPINIPSNTRIVCNGTLLNRLSHNSGAEYVGMFTAVDETNIDIDGVTVIGEGAISGAPIETCTFYFDRCENVTVQNCIITDEKGGQVIFFRNSDQCTARNNVIERYSYAAIEAINGCCNLNVLFNVVKECVNVDYGNTYPIVLSGYDYVPDATFKTPENVLCMGNYIENSIGTWEGIDSHGAKNLVISNNIIKGCQAGILIGTYNEFLTGDKCICEGNIVELATDVDDCRSGHNSCVAVKGDNVIVRNNLFVNGNVAVNGKASQGAIYIAGARNVDFNNNIVINPADIVFDIRESENIEIHENQIVKMFVSVTKGYVVQLRNSAYNRNVRFCNNKLVDSIGSIGFVNSMSNYTGDNYIAFFDNVVIGNEENVEEGNYYFWSIFSPRPSDAPVTPKMGKVGDIMRVSNPSVGTHLGWICTSSGSEGTDAIWVKLPNL